MRFKPIAVTTVLLLVVASLLVAGCTTSNTSTTNQTTSATSSDKATFTSARGYTITYPNPWKKSVNNTTTAPIDLYLYPNPNNTIDGVLGELNTTTGNTLQAFSDAHLKNLSTLSGYTMQSYESTTFAGEPANKIVWQAMAPQQISKNTTQNAQIKATWVLVVHDGKGYIVSYKATASDYDTYLTQAQEALNSFTFT
jgi:hypothetical protein